MCDLDLGLRLISLLLMYLSITVSLRVLMYEFKLIEAEWRIYASVN